jgi:hypothetical protein
MATQYHRRGDVFSACVKTIALKLTAKANPDASIPFRIQNLRFCDTFNGTDLSPEKALSGEFFSRK